MIPQKTYLVDIYIEGNNKELASIVDLRLDYDKSDLNLNSFNSYGILKYWNDDRFLIMPSNDKLDIPVLSLEFTKKGLFSSQDIEISDQSQVYLSHVGVSNLRNSKIMFIMK